MRLLFLDIDGVLNGYGWEKSFLRKIYRKVFHIKRTDLSGMLDPFRVKWISKLVKKYPDLKIVLSSSWRQIWDNHPDASTFLKKRNVEIYSKTPLGSVNVDSSKVIDWSVCQRCIDSYASLFAEQWTDEKRKQSFLTHARGSQILEWLKQNNIDSSVPFVILDDDYQDILCYDCLKKHTVVTKFYGRKYGLRKNHYKKICKILENK